MKHTVSASASDNAAVILVSAVILPTVAKVHGLEQSAYVGLRTQDHQKRSDAQMVTSMDTKGRSHTLRDSRSSANNR
jgi:hypothetical protein